MTLEKDSVGAFCKENHASLCGAAEGPLAGLGFAVKDIFHIAGHRTGFGSPTWLATHVPEAQTAPAVQRLVDAGASVLGKTLTDEMAYSLSGENSHYGTPVNVRAPGRIPGGSSNGSAAAVAAGLVDFALGTDCGGSVRIPASYCGILGIRPSLGRVSLAQVIPFSASFDVVGWFTRDAELLSRVGSVLLDPQSSGAKPTRLLIAEDAFAVLRPDAVDALNAAVQRVETCLGAAQSITVSPQGLESWFEVFRVIQAFEIWANHGTWIEQNRPDFGRGIRERMDWARQVTAEDHATACQRHEEIRGHLQSLLGEGDVLCLPSSPRVAPYKDAPADEVEIRYRHQAMQLLCIAGLGGLPQVSLPLAQLEGVPLGLSLIARHGDDEMLLGLAKEVMAQQ